MASLSAICSNSCCRPSADLACWNRSNSLATSRCCFFSISMAFMRCSPLENQRNHLPDGLAPPLPRQRKPTHPASSSRPHPLPGPPANAHPPLASSPDGVALGEEGTDVE